MKGDSTVRRLHGVLWSLIVLLLCAIALDSEALTTSRSPYELNAITANVLEDGVTVKLHLECTALVSGEASLTLVKVGGLGLGDGALRPWGARGAFTGTPEERRTMICPSK
jgi:hypothetical protein